MDPTQAAGGAAGTNAAGGGGNDKLQESFSKAIDEASKTLAISVEGQAQLNALRARPN